MRDTSRHRWSPNVGVALGQQAQHLAVTSHLDAPQVRRPQRGDRDRQGVVGVVLVRPAGREQACPRRAGSRHVDDDLSGSYELLGEQIAEPARGLDRPRSSLEGFGPRHELVDLAATGSQVLAGEFFFGAVDRDGAVGRLVRIDTDDH
jgi:hypothetical protein